MDTTNQTTLIKRPHLLQDEVVYKKAWQVLKSLDHPLPQAMCRYIHRHGRVPVSHISSKLRLEPSLTSQHLRWLRNSHVVSTNRDGKCKFYTLNYGRLVELNHLITTFIAYKAAIDASFNLPVIYKGTELVLKAQHKQLGYLTRYEVETNGTTVLSEPDEEQSYRALVNPSQLQGNGKLEIGLLKTIAAAIEALE